MIEKLMSKCDKKINARRGEQVVQKQKFNQMTDDVIQRRLGLKRKKTRQEQILELSQKTVKQRRFSILNDPIDPDTIANNF